jgi:succinate dehydrogenase hydrophobic anchor subunit
VSRCLLPCEGGSSWRQATGVGLILRLIVRILFAVAAAGATAYVALAGHYHWPIAHGGWYASLALFIVAICVISVNVMRTIVGDFLARFREDKSQATRRELEAALLTLWSDIEPLTAPIIEAETGPEERKELRRKLRDQLGLRVWLVPKWHRALGSTSASDILTKKFRRKLITPRLRLAARQCLEDLTEPSEVNWRRDKGALGKSWAIRSEFYFSNDEHWAAVASETEWDALPDDMTLGLTYEQSRRLLQFGQVMVMPIWKQVRTGRRLYAGCIAADLPRDTTNLFRLDSQRIKDLMKAASHHIAWRVL